MSRCGPRTGKRGRGHERTLKKDPTILRSIGARRRRLRDFHALVAVLGDWTEELKGKGRGNESPGQRPGGSGKEKAEKTKTLPPRSTL